MARISVIGMGYVGLVTAACFADLGNEVWCVELDGHKIELLRQNKAPFYEPGLEELIARNATAGRLRFTTRYEEAIPDSDFVFICVGTPMAENGAAELKYVRMAAESIGPNLRGYTIIVNKSTVPIGTGDMVTDILSRYADPDDFAVVSNPEFLREGSAVNDFFNPDRIVLGAGDRAAAEKVAELHAPLNAPVIITDLHTAEMIKYASNAFLATRISFINEIAHICERLGADVKEVARGMGMDRRIGPHFLNAGVGFGGSCFPKDVRALAYMAKAQDCHPQLLQAVLEINEDARRRFVARLVEMLGDLRGRTIGILGLSFKPNTDDMREAPSIEIITRIHEMGAEVKAYDPVAMPRAEEILPWVTYCATPYDVAKGADALLVVTEWNEFKQLNMERIRDLMRQPVLLDGRNVYEPAEMRRLGFRYYGVGRP
ncbi:MAG: UDP-glucose dehydrogenase family protein [Chloroflexia bacterium]